MRAGCPLATGSGTGDVREAQAPRTLSLFPSTDVSAGMGALESSLLSAKEMKIKLPSSGLEQCRAVVGRAKLQPCICKTQLLQLGKLV